MLQIILGECNKTNYISDPNMYFDNTYENDWITSDIGKEIIKEIDKDEVTENGAIISPVLDGITPIMLSGGAKTLMLINFDDEKIFNASACGNNCADLLLRITTDKDRVIRLGYPMHFNGESFEIRILNDGKVVHNRSEFLDEVNRYL